MKRLLIAACVALSACAAVPLTGPAPIANASTLDEQAALGAELAYKAARTALELATDAGLIKGSRATRVAALDNRAYAAVLAVRSAYRAGNSSDYLTASIEAQRAVLGLIDAIKGA